MNPNPKPDPQEIEDQIPLPGEQKDENGQADFETLERRLQEIGTPPLVDALLREVSSYFQGVLERLDLRDVELCKLDPRTVQIVHAITSRSFRQLRHRAWTDGSARAKARAQGAKLIVDQIERFAVAVLGSAAALEVAKAEDPQGDHLREAIDREIRDVLEDPRLLDRIAQIADDDEKEGRATEIAAEIRAFLVSRGREEAGS